ncbi:MAG: DUF2779 domain-containing protein [Erysipelotrichaceae bacterium]|nr:DUF2779 domain-containing protein [Erysipelotrichaceae bacterium]MDY5251759.1 DUF2779 domain-containing protein [Erysipelotrichaceae bacterium]
MYHISDVKKYLKCPLMFYNHVHNEPEEFRPYVRLDEKLTELARLKLQVDQYFLGQKNDDKAVALQALKEYDWLIKARFEYDNLRVKVPFLHRTNLGYDVYFVYCGNYPKDDDIIFYTLTLWVLKNNHIYVNDCYILHFNSEYIRMDALDPEQLFIISKQFYNDNNKPQKDIKETIFAKMRNFSLILKEMSEIENGPKPKPIRTNKCTKRNKCLYYQDCFQDELAIEDNSILTLVTSQYKYQMLASGIKYLKDANIDLLEGTRQQYAQIQADINGGVFVDKHALNGWLANIHYPIAFLDFEWDTYAIPPYKGMKPYDVLCFEYSLHILNEDGSIDHHEYVGTQDCRQKLIEHMINDIGKKGSIIAYNANGAEKIRIQEMIKQFPQYANELWHIYYRMEDLQHPFMLGMVYNTKMKGTYSLKTLMSILDEKAYKSLDINQGMEAVFNWRQIDNGEGSDNEEILLHLKQYCAMDTYAMVKVFLKLQELAKDFS